MLFEARALYDFRGEPNSAEMSIVAGELLKITRIDVGEGWWEGTNPQGKSGLFPEAYVEKIEPNDNAPPLPAWGSQMDWNAPITPTSTKQDDDDDWDDDTYSEVGQSAYTNEAIYENDNQNFQAGDVPGSVDNKAPVKKNLNRFSSFVKSGGEDYLLGMNNVAVSTEMKIRVNKTGDNVFTWPHNLNAFTVQITSPKKESKLKGLKTYIAYQLTPSFNNIQVSRRYKHFDWLHERLTVKFALLAIPPLPDKQISGRYEDQFIEHRRAQLQEFVDYVCRHPVLSKCEVWQHFLTCTDERLWKQGKRIAEKDQLVGAAFCYCIDAPDKTLLPSVGDNLENDHLPSIITLDNAFKTMLHMSSDVSKKYKSLFSKETSKIGTAFFELGSAIETRNKAIPCKLAQICKHVGTAYIEVGRLYEKQPTLDWDPMGDKFYLYKGITSSLQSSVFTTYRSCQQKRKDCEKSMQGRQLSEVKARSDVFTYITVAELQHFNNEQDTDLKQALKKHVQEQISFYQNIVSTLQKALNEFD